MVSSIFTIIYHLMLFLLLSFMYFVTFLLDQGCSSKISLGSASCSSLAYYLPLVLVGVFFITMVFVSNLHLSLSQDNVSSFLLLPLTTFFSPLVSFSNIKKIFFHILMIVTLVMLWPITSVECGNFDINQTARQRLFDLIETFSEEEMNQFHAQTTYNLGARVFLAVTINLIILGAVYYGPTVYNSMSKGINHLIHEDLPNIVQGIHTFFTETARQAVLREIQNADPQRLERLTNIANNIAANRPPRFPM